MKKVPLFCIFSFVLIIPGLYILIEHSLLVMNGEQYQGKITGFYYRQGGTPHSQKRRTTYPKVEFIDKNNQKRVVTTTNMEFLFQDYKINQSVSVYFDSKTGKLIINDIFSLWSQPIFLIILGSLICYFGRNLKLK